MQKKLKTLISFFHPFAPQEGVTLLLVIVIVSALLSISVGIFNVVYGQIKISGEINDSFLAIYAADQGMERIFYRDRVNRETLCAISGPNCFTESASVPSGACYTVQFSKVGPDTTVVSTGQFRCGINPNRVVKRGLEATY